MELDALQQALPGFEAQGARVIALCPELPEHSRGTVEQLGLTFPVLHDAGNQVGARYGLTFVTPDPVQAIERELGLDLPKHNGTDNWDLPMPTRVVIGANGRVEARNVHLDHAERTDPGDTLAVLRSLKQ